MTGAKSDLSSGEVGRASAAQVAGQPPLQLAKVCPVKLGTCSVFNRRLTAYTSDHNNQRAQQHATKKERNEEMNVNFVSRQQREFHEPKLVTSLLSGPQAGWIWLLPRLWIGYNWFEAGQHKFVDPKWIQTGEALKAYWVKAVAMPETGRPPISFDWYRTFIQSLIDSSAHTWFAPLVVYGEMLVGIALILGAFTGIAAFAGAFMNWNFMMAGSASTNPMMFVVAMGVILAWRVSGAIGLDHYLLPLIGVPWTWRDGEAVESPPPGVGAPAPAAANRDV